MSTDGITLADKFLQDPNVWYKTETAGIDEGTRRRLKLVTQRLREARRFVLDPAASARVSTVAREVPDFIADNVEFARQPFDLMWIELDSRALMGELLGEPSDSSSDVRLGFLVDHGIVHVIAEGPEKIGGKRVHENVKLMPEVYIRQSENLTKINREQAEVLERDPNTISLNLKPATLYDSDAGTKKGEGDLINVLYWGRQTYDRLDEVRRGTLKTYWRFYLDGMTQQLEKELGPGGAVAQVVSECAGELKTLVTILLLLNCPSVTRYVREVPQRRGLHRGRPVRYWAHSRITFDLDRPRELVTVNPQPSGDGEARRRHEVRGHWCHDEKARAGSRLHCDHGWRLRTAEDVPWAEYDDKEVFFCDRCGGQRWWRAQHARGDATKGYVEHAFKVKADKA